MSRNLGRQYQAIKSPWTDYTVYSFPDASHDRRIRPAATDGRDERHHRRQLEGDGAALDGSLLPVRQQIQPHSGL